MWSSKNKGFTLLEVMLAVTILSVGMVMVVRSYLTSLRTIKISRNLLTANLLLEEKIWQKQQEQTQAEGIIPDEEAGEFAAPFDSFSYKISFAEQDLPSEYKGTLYKTSFKVFWQQGKKEYSTSSVTFLGSKEE